MTEQQTSKKGFTPPKGRPTRARNEMRAERRVFGPTAQWIAVVFLLVVAFVLLIVFLDGGDFNPFNNDDLGTALGSVVAVVHPSS